MEEVRLGGSEARPAEEEGWRTASTAKKAPAMGAPKPADTPAAEPEGAKGWGERGRGRLRRGGFGGAGVLRRRAAERRAPAARRERRRWSLDGRTRCRLPATAVPAVRCSMRVSAQLATSPFAAKAGGSIDRKEWGGGRGAPICTLGPSGPSGAPEPRVSEAPKARKNGRRTLCWEEKGTRAEVWTGVSCPLLVRTSLSRWTEISHLAHPVLGLVGRAIVKSTHNRSESAHEEPGGRRDHQDLSFVEERRRDGRCVRSTHTRTRSAWPRTAVRGLNRRSG